MTMGLDRTYHAHQFIFRFTLHFFILCDTKWAIRQLFTPR